MYMILRRPRGSTDMDWTVYLASGDDTKMRMDLQYLRENVKETEYCFVQVKR